MLPGMNSDSVGLVTGLDLNKTLIFFDQCYCVVALVTNCHTQVLLSCTDIQLITKLVVCR